MRREIEAAQELVRRLTVEVQQMELRYGPNSSVVKNLRQRLNDAHLSYSLKIEAAWGSR